MKRRSVLTGAAALAAGGSLTACGGGNESEVFGEGSPGEIAAPLYSIPKLLVGQQGMYDVEVVFHTSEQLVVELIHVNTRVGSFGKGVTPAGHALAVRHGYFRTHQEGLYSASNFHLRVSNQSKTYYVTAGISAATETSTRRYFEHIHDDDGLESIEYEWDFLRDYKPMVSVRFHLVPFEDRFEFPAGKFFLAAADWKRSLATHQTLQTENNSQITAPVVRATSERLPDFEARVITAKATSGRRSLKTGAPAIEYGDTLVLPVLRDGKVGEHSHDLVRTYMGASADPHSRDAVGRRLERHMIEFIEAARNKYTRLNPDGTWRKLSEDQIQGVKSMMLNEVFRLVGGNALIDEYNRISTAVSNGISTMQATVNNAFNDWIDEISAAMNVPAGDTTISENLETTSTADLNSQEDRFFRGLEQVFESEPESVNIFLGWGMASTVNLQVGVSSAIPNFPCAGLSAGLGFRLSLGLHKRSKVMGATILKTQGDEDLKSNLKPGQRYSITEHETKGVKVGAVGIVKVASSRVILINGVDVDIEITVNSTYTNGRTRVDSVTFDPVLDVDGRAFAGRMILRVMNFLADLGAGLVNITKLASGCFMAGLRSLNPYYVPTIPTTIRIPSLQPPPAETVVPAQESLMNFRDAGVTVVRNGAERGVSIGDRGWVFDLKNYFGYESENGVLSITPRYWSTVEFSPLRMSFVNGGLKDDIASDTPNWTPSNTNFYYHPALKFITGTGAELKVINNDLNTKVFTRIVNVADFFPVFGLGEAAGESLAFVWES